MEGEERVGRGGRGRQKNGWEWKGRDMRGRKKEIKGGKERKRSEAKRKEV